MSDPTPASVPSADADADVDANVVVRLDGVAFLLELEDAQFNALQYWIDEIERVTRFDEDDVLAACGILYRLGLYPSWVIASLRAIAAYAHAHNRPLPATAEQVGTVMNLADMYPGELGVLFDLCEEVGE